MKKRFRVLNFLENFGLASGTDEIFHEQYALGRQA
jgi:hypothetical protein